MSYTDALIPKISIGMPVRNGGEYIKGALESLLEQTEQNFEIIISDNNSDDGSSEYLESIAKNDARIIYTYQESPIRAYDNFKYVLQKARGKYFMWAAHDDLRDKEFIELLVDALENDPEAVLAFPDLNIITPQDMEGNIMAFDFQTAKMKLLARLSKLSRKQCYYIYGIWRTEAINRIPYAYCAWWPDLPMMLSAAILGTFIHVPGVRFHYLEYPKSNLHRVKNQDYASKFNLLFGVLGLVRATYRACVVTGGFWVAGYCAALVVLKQVINLPGYIYRRIKNVIVRKNNQYA